MHISEIRAARKAEREAQTIADAKALAHAKANPITAEERDALKATLGDLIR